MVTLDQYLSSLRQRVARFMKAHSLSKSAFGAQVSNDKLLNGLDKEVLQLSSIRKIEAFMASHERGRK